MSAEGGWFTLWMSSWRSLSICLESTTKLDCVVCYREHLI